MCIRDRLNPVNKYAVTGQEDGKNSVGVSQSDGSTRTRYGGAPIAESALPADSARKNPETGFFLERVSHSDGSTRTRYGGEPYVLAGDVYANGECPGRVGWTWYTGSAGWLYTAVLRCLLGLQPRGDRLLLTPCLPAEWDGYTLEITLRGTRLDVYKRHPSPC